MKEFQAPLDDIMFTIRHVLDADRLPGWDDDLATEIVTHFARFAEQRLAPLDALGDAEGCRMEDERVRMPSGFVEAYGELAEQGWQGLGIPGEFGGMDVHPLIRGAISEIFTGANHSLQMIVNLVPGAAETLLNHGSQQQRELWLPLLAAGTWLSTMCLTEPGAGSDLSAIRCRASEHDGSWSVSGEKTFISGGDQDLTDGTLHLVLARSGKPEDGLKGLTLLLVPSLLPDGTRNRVSVGRIEKKLGLHASPTCHMVFDGAIAEPVGEVGGGLAAMFTMMNHARLDVAMQGVAHAARASDIAETYSASRVQGRGADGRPTAIAQHADVRAMLDEIDALALGARAMCLLTYEELASSNTGLADLLTPICKWFATNAGIRAADLSIQVLGGYGYLAEYRAEQNWRDARICSIYEGTNGVHAKSLATRLLLKRHGGGPDALVRFLGQDFPSRETERWLALSKRVAESGAVESHASEFMKETAALVFLAAWRRIASRAAHHPDPARIGRLAEFVFETWRPRGSELA